MILNSPVSIDLSKVRISKGEAAQRLRTPVDFESEITDECELMLREKAEPRYYFAEFNIGTERENIIDFGFSAFQSADLYKNLRGCKSAYIMAVTLGMGVDRLINTARLSSPSKAFVLDALSSALAEAAADYVSSVLAEGHCLRPRYSPGYGDLSLETQRDILKVLSADKILGIKLGENLLMTPRKTITAIQGVLE